MVATENTVRQNMVTITLLHSVALAVISVGATYEWLKNDGSIASSVYLLFFTHIAFSLISGRFIGAYAKTWVLLVLAFLAMQAIIFLSYLIPYGQISFQIAQMPAIGVYINNFYENIEFLGINGSAVLLLIFLLFIGFNIAARFQLTADGDGLTERLMGIGAVMVLAILVASSLFDGPKQDQSLLTPFKIVPEWYLLPFYSALRAVPDKMGGVVALVAMLSVPIAALFITNAKSKARKWIVRGLLLLCFLGFWGLGYYGAHAAEQDILFRSRLLLGCYFAYFLIGPFLTPRRRKRDEE